MRLDLSRRTDGELLREFSSLVEKDRRSTAELIAYVGEIQARRLFAPAGYSSLYSYRVSELHRSEDMAWKRTRVARLARRFPVILEMIADGRLHLTAAVMLLPYRDAADFPRLLEAAGHRTKPELERMLAERFPRPDSPSEVRALATSERCQKLVPEPVVQTQMSKNSSVIGGTDTRVSPGLGGLETSGPATDGLLDASLPATPGAHGGLETDDRSATPPEPRSVPRSGRVQPLAPQRFAIQVTVGQATHDKLHRAQELLGRRVSSGDLEQVLDRALDALIRQLEHARIAATEKPRHPNSRATTGSRHVPAHVKRAVHERDGGRCKFVSDSGRRCEERRDLQFDHVEPFARGGEATVAGIRLLCPAHNQFEAERVFGAGFMARKRPGPARGTSS